jgi:hypothetical protein
MVSTPVGVTHGCQWQAGHQLLNPDRAGLTAGCWGSQRSSI